MSPLERIKAVYFFILLLVVLALYILNMLNVANNPAYLHSQSAFDNPTGRAFYALFITTAILLVIYGLFFLVTLIRNFWYLCRLTP